MQTTCTHTFIECARKKTGNADSCSCCVLVGQQEQCFERGLLLPDDVVLFCSKCGELKREEC